MVQHKESWRWVWDGTEDEIPSHLCKARVVQVNRGRVVVIPHGVPHTDRQQYRTCVLLKEVLKSSDYEKKQERTLLSVGDLILIHKDNNEVHHIFPRENELRRQDPLHPHINHVIVANTHGVMIVESYGNFLSSLFFIDNIIVQCTLQSIPIHIVLNKIDVLPKNEKTIHNIQEMIAVYRSLGYTVHTIQANALPLKDKKTFQSLFKDERWVLCGHSGVGKSTFINHLNPLERQIVDPESNLLSPGRHITSMVTMVPLKQGGHIIDTPGLRMFHLKAETHEIGLGFIEFRDCRCKYQPCYHIQEPHCGVKTKYGEGKIHTKRFENYRKILSLQ